MLDDSWVCTTGTTGNCLSKSTFRNNTAESGGALFAHHNSSLTFSKNTFQNNSAGNAGGALYAYMNIAFTLSENTFQDNFASYSGGALAAMINNYINLSENTFQNNSAGGALYANISNIKLLTCGRDCIKTSILWH